MKTWGYDLSLMYPKYCKYETYLSLCCKWVKIKQLWTNIFFLRCYQNHCMISGYFFGLLTFLLLQWAFLPNAALLFVSRHPHFLVFVCLMISAGKNWCVHLLKKPVRNRSFGSWKSNELFKDSRDWVCKSTGLESYSKQKLSGL